MLTVEEIKRFIEDDALSDRKRKAAEGQRYYDAEHDILNYRMFYYNDDGVLVEDKARANSRICHPFFTELVDQLAAYVLSFEENPMQAKETAEGLQDLLDEYFDEEFWAEVQELVAGAYTKGFEYLYASKNAEDRLTFKCADSLGVIEVRAKETDDGCEYVIYWYVDRVGKDKKAIKRIEVYDKDQIWFYTQEDNGAIVLDDNEPVNPKPNIVWRDKETGAKFGGSLGFIPFWRLDYCKKQFSGLKPIKGLIDDYDLMECGLSNNLQDFDTPIHLVKGFHGDNYDELQQNIKTKKLLGVDAEGGLEVLTVNVPYQARKTKADEDEKNIYKFGMGFNSSQTGDGNITNVVIQSRYTLLNLKAGKVVRRLKKFLKGIIHVVIDEINEAHNKAYQYSDVSMAFEFITPANEQEAVQNRKTEAETRQIEVNTILNIAAEIGDEQLLKAICAVMEWDYDEIKELRDKSAEGQNTADDARALLNSIPPDDDDDEDEEA